MNRDELLEYLRRNKSNNSLADLEALLKAWGFTPRKAKKESALWSRGSHTITTPNQHGKTISPRYFSIAIKEIDLVRAEIETTEEDENGEA